MGLRGGGGGSHGAGREVTRSSQKSVKAGRKEGLESTEEFSFQYRLLRRWRGIGGRTARPAVSRRRRKAWWSEVVGMYLAILGRDSKRGGRKAVSILDEMPG